MSDLNFDMNGVQPMGEQRKLPEGQYVCRFEWTGWKAGKDKFDANNLPMPGNGINYYLYAALKVWTGPEAGHEENIILNLLNLNDTAVRIAKSELKSLFMAVGGEFTDSKLLRGRWLVLSVYLNRSNELAHKYEMCPPNFIPAGIAAIVPRVEEELPAGAAAALAAAKNAQAAHHAPAPATHAPAPQQQTYAPQPQHAPAPALQQYQPSGAPPAAANPNDIPDWAKPKG